MSTTSATSPWPGNGLGLVFDFATASHKRALGALLVVSLLLFLPGFFQIPPVDRDEAYFAQATKQMIQTGDYVDIRYQDDVRYRKPVGIYWLQAAVVKTAQALGDSNALTTIWLYRIPSLIGAVGAVLTTYWCALAFVSRRGAVLAAIMLAASTLLGVEARLAKTDAVLLFTIVAAMSRPGARLSFAERSRQRSAGLEIASDLLDCACGRHPDQGAGQPDGRRPCGANGIDFRAFRPLASGITPARRHRMAVRYRAAMVHRDLCARRHCFFCRRAWPRHVGKGCERPRGPWRASRPLFPSVLCNLLSGLNSCRHLQRRRFGACAGSRPPNSCWHG